MTVDPHCVDLISEISHVQRKTFQNLARHQGVRAKAKSDVRTTNHLYPPQG